MHPAASLQYALLLLTEYKISPVADPSPVTLPVHCVRCRQPRTDTPSSGTSAVSSAAPCGLSNGSRDSPLMRRTNRRGDNGRAGP